MKSKEEKISLELEKQTRRARKNEEVKRNLNNGTHARYWESKQEKRKAN